MSGTATPVTARRLTARRFVAAPASDIFAVLCDPEGHVDHPMGRYDVEVVIDAFEVDRAISWSIEGPVRCP